MSIPSRMALSSKMEAAQSLLSKAILTALDIKDGGVSPASSPGPFSEVLPQHTGSSGSICFVVRRPGWVLCREHGRQLTHLANDTTNDGNIDLMTGFKMFGTVKEIGVDDEGLAAFYNEHFTYPLYKDDGLIFYNDFFGKKKLKLTTYNPFKLYSGYKDMTKRMKEKKLKGNMVGEGFVKGGVIIFDKQGKARYAYEEETGKELNMEDIVTALNSVRTDA